MTKATKEEVKAFKPIINSMKLIREYCELHRRCVGCIFDRCGSCPIDVPEHWECEEAIAMLEEAEVDE